MATRRLQHDFIGNDVNLSKTIKDVADESDKAADKLDKTAQSTKGLDEQMAKTSKTVAALRKEIAETGDTSLFRSLAKSENELKKLTRIKESFGKAGEESGSAFSNRMGSVITMKLARLGEPVGSALSASFSSMPPQAQAAVGAAMVGLVVTAAPLAGAAAAAALIGGAGTGGIIGGLVLAAKNPQVKAEATGLGESVGAMLSGAAESFVPVTIGNLAKVRTEIISWEPEIRKIFDAASSFVDPLVDGALGFVEAMLPGLRAAVEAGEPFFEMLSQELPELGRDVGELFATAAKYSDEAASAAGVLLDSFGFLVDTVSSVVMGLSEAYGFLVRIKDFLAGDDGVTSHKKELKKAGSEAEKTAGSFTLLGDSAATAAGKVESLAEMIDRVTGENISAEQANIRLEEAIDRATEAGKRNNDGIDVNTEKGRANRQALLGIAEAAGQSYEAILAQTGSTQQASAASERGRAAFISAAEAMGVEKAEAIKLANQLFRIPDEVNTRANLDKAAAERDLKGLLTWINRIDGRSVDVTVNVRAGQRSGVGGLGGLTFSHGGAIDGPGPKGIDSVPIIAAKGEHVFTAPEVDRMGGQAAVTQFRRDLMSGQTPSAGGSGRRVGQGITEDGMYRAMVRALRTVPVSRDPGRIADMYARGG